ncbi:MAG TPA: PhoH family protein, partial [Actinopolymorphaceae bacterium]
MTQTSQRSTSQATIVIPNSIPMVTLLGPRDELLRIVEKSFDALIHVRGNEITVDAQPEETATVERLFDELVAVIRSGQGLTADAVEHAIAMLRGRETASPADVLTLNILSNRGRTIRPKTLGQKQYVDAID